MKKDPSKDFDSCEDFFITVVHSLILCACLSEFEMNGLDESPAENLVSADAWLTCEDYRRSLINDLCNRVVEKSVKFQYVNDAPVQPCKDLVTEYGLQLLSIGICSTLSLMMQLSMVMEKG